MKEEFPSLCRGSNGLHVLNWSVSRPVYGFPVDREPIADGAKTLLKFRLDQPVRLRTNVQQEVTATARDFHKAPNEKLCRLIFSIVRVICRSLVDGHAGFPQLKIFWRGSQFLRFPLNAGIGCGKTHAL